MYGYVRPVKGELKVSEYELFRGVYCGLCHELARRYGFWGRFLVNYDFTFLAMLLSWDEAADTCPRRCPAHPARRTACLVSCAGLETAADQSVILAWWKLRDGAADKRFPASLGYRLACAVLSGAYRRAASRQPDFAGAVRRNLQALDCLEEAKCSSIDETADKFALILRAIADSEPSDERRRILGELFYHLGRIIYILDAVDDLAEDERSGDYNPLRYRFRLAEGKLSEEDEQTLRLSMQHSHNAILAAYALLKESPYSGIVSNIIYLGLPAATQAVFEGKWKPAGRLHRERRNA